MLISTDQAVRPANLMGASKRLAEQMVRLSGLSLRDAQNPKDEIAITCTGLRPGEKPYPGCGGCAGVVAAAGR